MSVYQSSPILNTATTEGKEAAGRRSGYRITFKGALQMRRAAEREAFVLLLVSFIDMMTTLFWVSTGRATEANPLLGWTFNHHPIGFVLVKMAATLPAIFLAPKLAQKYPAFTIWLLRAVIVAYVLIYFKNL